MKLGYIISLRILTFEYVAMGKKRYVVLDATFLQRWDSIAQCSD